MYLLRKYDANCNEIIGHKANLQNTLKLYSFGCEEFRIGDDLIWIGLKFIYGEKNVCKQVNSITQIPGGMFNFTKITNTWRFLVVNCQQETWYC